MNKRKNPMQKQLVFAIGKINSQFQLRSAITHNKRAIAKELVGASHIDSTKTHLNYSMLDTQTSSEVMLKVKEAAADYQRHTGRSLRRDAVLAIEILFSVSAANLDIDHGQYFLDCLQWAKNEFAPAEPLSAEVHLDESNPHMHMIFLCVIDKRLVASSVTGYKRKFQDRRDNFYAQVAKKHDLEMPPPALSRINRMVLAQKIVDHFDSTADPITLSEHYPTICDAIRLHPMSFASILGGPSTASNRKMRTVAQIFTSKGRGPSWRKHE